MTCKIPLPTRHRVNHMSYATADVTIGLLKTFHSSSTTSSYFFLCKKKYFEKNVFISHILTRQRYFISEPHIVSDAHVSHINSYISVIHQVHKFNQIAISLYSSSRVLYILFSTAVFLALLIFFIDAKHIVNVNFHKVEDFYFAI